MKFRMKINGIAATIGLALSGRQAKLSRPLDFLMVADHSDGFEAPQ